MLQQTIKSVIISALSVPEHCLIFYFVCDDDLTNSNFLCCVITQNGESIHDLLLCVTNRKALAAPPAARAPCKALITLLPVTFSQLDQQFGVGWGKRFIL